MRSYRALAILAVAISWVLANTAWLSIGDEDLVGTELIQLLNLIPGISLLLIFIAGYRKLEKSLLVLSAVAMTGFVYLALTTELTSTTAATKIYESLSGIQGAGPADIDLPSNPSLMPWFSAAATLVAVVLTLLSALKPTEKAQIKRQEVEDNRALWDEQSD
ncbi:MAG: hypothetical protein RIS08_545 [Actinomycetota bacterium]